MLVKMETGGSGGGGESTVYWFTYASPNYYLFKNGTLVKSGQSQSYEDDNIYWSMSGHACTLRAKTDIRLHRNSTANPTITEYSAGDYIYNSQANFYTLVPVCLQKMYC